jgi:hypothetical protein
MYILPRGGDGILVQIKKLVSGGEISFRCQTASAPQAREGTGGRLAVGLLTTVQVSQYKTADNHSDRRDRYQNEHPDWHFDARSVRSPTGKTDSRSRD